MIEVSDGTGLKSRVRMRCWGELRLAEPAGLDLRPRGRKARALLAYLALHPGIRIGRERLLGLLWGERGEEQARASLRQAIQELKPLANGRGIIAIDRESLTLHEQSLATDLDLHRWAFEQQAWPELIAGLPEPHERLFADLDGLDSGFDDWLAIERARQNETLLGLLAEARAAALRAGDRRMARTLEARLRERDPEGIMSLDDPVSAPVAPAPEAAAVANPLLVQSEGSKGGQRRRWLVTAALSLLLVGGVSSWALAPRDSSTSAAGNPLTTSSEVLSLYLAARARVRERNPQAIEESRDLLERALARDPNFAPAWARLALVARLEGNRPGPTGERARAESLRHAQHALQLAPDLAEGHGILGVILGFDNAVGQRHIERAAALDPESPEIQYWLGNAHLSRAHYPRALAAFRRAFELDPTWVHVATQATETALALGRREEAMGYVRRLEREGSVYDARLLRGLTAANSGDLSAAAADLAEARASTDDLGKQAIAVYNRAVIMYALGLTEQAQSEWASCRLAWAEVRHSGLTMPERFAGHLALQRGQIPSPARLAEMNRDRGDIRVQILLREVVGRLIAAGRAQDAVALYDSPPGLLGFSSSRPEPTSPEHLTRYGPTIAAALMAVGRGREARQVLLRAERQVDQGLRSSSGQVSAHFLGEAAAIWAMLGKSDLALAALERAVRTGWLNADLRAEDLPDDLGSEPAFRTLRGHPRFERLRETLDRHLERERAELLRALA
ncbi:MAG TPA: hypothetical protein VFO69_00045 [Allosphingosinicella sp.]|nr:hypothetical protein [Allosphingosinicella sp.]